MGGRPPNAATVLTEPNLDKSSSMLKWIDSPIFRQAGYFTEAKSVDRGEEQADQDDWDSRPRGFCPRVGLSRELCTHPDGSSYGIFDTCLDDSKNDSEQ